ncbi:MAG: hypothetical protein FWG81_01670 [Betaproteobacteria bacterium]|nr:hypothetical protein [Betaproteobacteria bacterium]
MSRIEFDYRPLSVEKARETLTYAIERHRELAYDLERMVARVQINQRSLELVFEAVEAACNALEPKEN